MKNKNKPDEELKKVAGGYFFSESENKLYTFEGEEQQEVKDVKKAHEEIGGKLKSIGAAIGGIFEKLGIKPETKEDDFFGLD